MITLLFGENSFEIDRERQKLVADFSGEAEKIEGSEVERDQLLSIFMGQSLFSENRLVFISGLSEQSDYWNALPEWAGKLSDTTHIVLLEGKLDKRTGTYKWLQKNVEMIECKLWGQRDSASATSWTVNEAKKRGLNTSRANIQFLVNRVGLDQWRLAGTLEKLALVDEINEATITEHIDAHPEENVFSLFETALSGKSGVVQQKIALLQQTEDPFMVFGFLASQVMQFSALVLSDKSPESVAKDIGAHPFVLSKLSKYAQGMTKTQAKELLESAAQADIDMKSGSDQWIVIEHFLLNVANK